MGQIQRRLNKLIVALLVTALLTGIFLVATPTEAQTKTLAPVTPAVQRILVSDQSNYYRIQPGNGIDYYFYKGTLGYNSLTVQGSTTVIVLNERWELQIQDKSQWKVKGIPYKVTLDTQTDTYTKISRHYSDYTGTTFQVTYEFYAGCNPKITFNGNIAAEGTYRVVWDGSGINTAAPLTTQSNIVSAVVDNKNLVFDYTDVYREFGDITTVTSEAKAGDSKVTLTFNVGILQAGAFKLDPSLGYSNAKNHDTTNQQFVLPQTSGNITLDSQTARVQIDSLTLQKSTVDLYSVYSVDDSVHNLQGKDGYVHVYPIANGVEYVFSTTKRQNTFTFQLNTTGYTVHQDGSLLTELPERDYIVWTETYAWDGENETRKDISLVGCLRFIPDGSITESVIIKRPYIYDFTGRGVWGEQSLNGNVLTVTVPKEFLEKAVYPIYVDPTIIFSDGFESNDFSAWTSTSEGSGCTVETSDTWSHHGTYSAHFLLANGQTAASARKTLASSQDFIAVRLYVKWVNISDSANGQRQQLIRIMESDTVSFAAIGGVEYVDGHFRWWLTASRFTEEDIYALSDVALDTVYCVEVTFDYVNGECKLYVDGTALITLNFDGEINNKPQIVDVGAECAFDIFGPIENSVDCVQVSNSYIGTEATGIESLEVSLNTPSNASTITSYSQNFTYTPTLLGSDAIQNASLYIDNSLVASNTTAITNATANSIAYNFTSNGTYDWTIGVWNTTHQVFPSSNYTLTVNVSTTESSASNDEAIAIAFLAVACAVAFPVVFLTTKKRNET